MTPPHEACPPLPCRVRPSHEGDAYFRTLLGSSLGLGACTPTRPLRQGGLEQTWAHLGRNSGSLRPWSRAWRGRGLCSRWAHLLGPHPPRIPGQLMAVGVRFSDIFLAAEKLDLKGGFKDEGELSTQKREHDGEGVLDRGTLCAKRQR